jgi:hypothetical protein
MLYKIKSTAILVDKSLIADTWSVLLAIYFFISNEVSKKETIFPKKLWFETDKVRKIINFALDSIILVEDDFETAHLFLILVFVVLSSFTEILLYLAKHGLL